MKRSILISALCLQFFAIPGFAYAPVPAEIEKHVKVHMPDHQFLDTDFHEWVKQTRLWTINGPLPKRWSLQLNFNGDGITDWVGYLVDASKTDKLPRQAVGLFCICSSGDSYIPIQLGDIYWLNVKDGVFFNLVKWLPGTYTNHDKSTAVDIQTEIVLEDTFFDSTGGMYYWDGVEVKYLTLSD